MNISSSCQNTLRPNKGWKESRAQTHTHAVVRLLVWIAWGKQGNILKSVCVSGLSFVWQMWQVESPVLLSHSSVTYIWNLMRKQNDETREEAEIHFPHPSIYVPLINVSLREIEWHHLSVFIRLGWTQSRRPFRVHTHGKLIEDKSNLEFLWLAEPES